MPHTKQFPNFPIPIPTASVGMETKFPNIASYDSAHSNTKSRLKNPTRFLVLAVCFAVALCFAHCASKPSSGIQVAGEPASFSDCKRCIVITEQAQNRIVIVDVTTGAFLWQWRADSSNVKREHVKWFNTPSDAKPVYGSKYVLITASGGGVALIRIADHKAVFYAYAGGNPHSAELLPDGNIVSASSTENYLAIFKTDTLVDAEQVKMKKQFIEFGHNVVWDKQRQVLYSAAMDKLKVFRYNNDCNDPSLSLVDSIPLPGTEAHDLFPQYTGNKLWLTNTTNVYTYDTKKKKLLLVPGVGANVKSITNGPEGYPVMITVPKEKWWTDEVLDTEFKSIFKQSGLRIYKARWWVANSFSYSAIDSLKLCK